MNNKFIEIPNEINPYLNKNILSKIQTNFNISIENPHLEQSKNNLELINKNCNNVEIKRIVNDKFPDLQYQNRTYKDKSVVHWGQRKLMLSEIEFLTLYAEKGITCVYAGSAPGNHITFLSDMFHEINFVLIDPSDFSIKETDRIKIRKEYMTNDVAKEYTNIKTLFISDIRSVDFKIANRDEVDIGIDRDMKWQMDWYFIIKPKAGMFKFKLPWNNDKTEYIDGDIYLPVYGSQSTTESRLITTSFKLKKYDNKKYENQMYYFNNILRVCHYKHDIKVEGIDHCYDCSTEIYILKNYLLKYGDKWLIDYDLNKMIEIFIEKLTIECGGGGLYGRNLINWQKKTIFKPKTFDYENKKVITHK
jgi:hypothetical protein